jgi:hypothetical protein
MPSSRLLGSAWTAPRRGFAGAHALREARNAESQIDAADRAKMALAKHSVLFGAVLTRRPGVDTISGRTIGNASHDSFPVRK